MNTYARAYLVALVAVSAMLLSVYWSYYFEAYLDLNPKRDNEMFDYWDPFVYFSLARHFVLMTMASFFGREAGGSARSRVVDMVWFWFSGFVVWLVYVFLMKFRFSTDIFVVSSPYDCFVTPVYMIALLVLAVGPLRKVRAVGSISYRLLTLVVMFVPTVLVNGLVVFVYKCKALNLCDDWKDTSLVLGSVIKGVLLSSPVYFLLAFLVLLFLAHRRRVTAVGSN